MPPEKLQDMLQELTIWLAKRSTTKRELLSLIGKLSFAARAVPAGRLFLRRLIHLSTSVTKMHHHIRLTTDAQADIDWWYSFFHRGTAQPSFFTPQRLLQKTWSFSPMPLAQGVGHTSRVHGSTTHGNHTKPSTPSSGRNYLPSLQQRSLGATSGTASGSGSTVTTRP